MPDPARPTSPASSRSQQHKRKARRGQLLHLVWIGAFALLSLWWWGSGHYYASCIEALDIEQDLPAGLTVSVADFTMSYHGGRLRPGYEPRGTVTLTNASERPINLAGKHLFLDFRAGRKLEWQHSLCHWKLDADQLAAKLAGEALPEFEFAPGAVKKIRIPEGRRQFLGGVDRLIVFMPR